MTTPTTPPVDPYGATTPLPRPGAEAPETGPRSGMGPGAAQQPKILRGLTHGAGPQGNFDYVIVAATAAVVLFTLVYAIKCLVRPGEREATHIKRIVLEQEYHGS